MKKLYSLFFVFLFSILFIEAQNTINFQALAPIEGDMSADVSIEGDDGTYNIRRKSRSL